VPDTPEETSNANDHVTRNDIVQIIDVNDPSITSKRRGEQVSEDHSGSDQRVVNNPYISTTRGPWVI
jgi:hypothetical protein